MNRIAGVFAVVLLATAALILLFVWLLPRDTLKTRVGEQIAAWTGRDVSLRGEPEIDFFPELTVTLQDVQVSGPRGMDDAELMSMDRLTGSVRLLPLLIGQVEIGSFTLVRPRVRLVLDASGNRNWVFDSGAAALQLAFAGDVPLGEFVVEDGTVLFENRRNAAVERLDSVNLTVDWGSVRQPVKVGGFGIWRGEQVSFSGVASNPFDFLRGASSPVEARFDSAPLAALFTGAASDINAPRLAGELSLSTSSLRGFAAWLGSPIGPGSTLGSASLSGTASFHDTVLSVQDAQLSLDGNSASGALDVVTRARPAITGTLAFANLDLTPYFAGFADAFGPGGNWRGVTLGTGWFDDITADIRLSAGSAQIGGLRFGDTAASVSLRESRLEVGIAGAAFNGGSLSGAVAVTQPAGAEALVEVQMRGADFDIAQAAQALGRAPNLAGTASVATDVESRGADLGSLMAGLRGTAKLDLKSGTFPLLGIAEMAAPGAGAAPRPAAAASPVNGLTLGFSLAGGIAVLERASLSAAAFVADAKGWIGLLDGSLGLNGSVSPVNAGVAGPAVPFTIGGTLAQPLAQPLAAAN